ncbi:MAG: DUF2203 domain-containing protein [Planctomycetes bacterium]|nr:DUF2203 domain-containing protein [Planctomycetota bacterium]
MDERQFSVDEANRTLPLLRMIAQDIVETHAELAGLRKEYESLRKERHLKDDDLPPANSDLYRMDETLVLKMLKIQSFVKEIEEFGGILRDVGEGEVDFVSTLDGRKIHLCWKLGEERVCHWHEPEETGVRQPLPVMV